MNRVACYIRVSTEEQKLHGISLDAQRFKLTEYAKIHNLNIMEWYCDEGVSGRKPISKRPELQRMIQDGEKKLFDRIIFIKLDRFFRSVAEYHDCMKRLGSITWTATEEQYDLTTANGRMFVNMKLTIAELEADQTSERIKLVNEYKVKQGQAIYGHQALPYGYTTTAIDGKKIVIKDKEKEHIAKEMIETFMDYRSIGKTAEDMFNKYQLKYDVVKKFFRSPIIKGTYRDNLSYCEAYVSEEEWNTIQDTLNNKYRYSPTKVREYIFSGLCVCACCNKKMRWSKVRSYYKGKPRYEYKRVLCESRAKNRSCHNKKNYYESTIERIIISETEKKYGDPHINAHSVQAEQKQINHEAEIKRLNYMFEKGRISIEEYDKKYAALQEKKPVKNKKSIVIDANWKEIYNMATPAQKNIFWKQLIKEIDIDDNGQVTIQWC